MEPASSSIDIRKYLFVLRRRWMLSLTIFLVVVVIGIAYCMFWPKVYQATALVVVQPQKVPGSIVSPTVTSKIQERLQIITQQVLSRTRLTEIIERFGLYTSEKGKTAPNDLAEAMRQKIDIKITRQNYFTITYTYPDPRLCASVTNALAAYYVDSNLRIREEDAVGTARFLAREVERMKGQLEDWEARITKFKEAHLHELPDAQDKNLWMLSELQDEIVYLTRNIQTEHRNIRMLEQELGAIEYREQTIALRLAGLRARGGGTAASPMHAKETEPELIKKQIEKLRLAYTPNHPDILILEERLARAEAKKAEELAERRAEAERQGKKLVEQKPFDPNVSLASAEMKSVQQSKQLIAKRIKEAHDRIAQFDNKRQESVHQLDVVRKRIENGPQVAEKLTELTRGYDVLKNAYEKTHAKWLEANMSANLERTARGEQFEVVDPAQVPDSPFRPDIKKALPLSILAALFLAVGISFVLNYIDTSFTSVEQVENLTELPVLVVLPPLNTAREEARKSRRVVLFGLVYGVLFLGVLALLAILLTGKSEAFKNLIMRTVGS